MHFGSPEQWLSLIETQVPDILALVIETWEAMPPPAGNSLEDPVSELLCRSLRKSRNRCDLPFRIDTQLVELDPAAGQDQGRMDIVFSPPVPRENIYFCLECKRINVRGEDKVRPYFVEYVRFGMFRFVRGQYATSVRHGGMLAFVLDGDVAGAISGVEINVRNLFTDLGMDAPGAFLTSTVRVNDARVRETRHRRASHAEPFVIHHLFMAGDSNAPLLPRASADSASAIGRSKRKITRRKSASNAPTFGSDPEQPR
jgi:hypothetical protein